LPRLKMMGPPETAGFFYGNMIAVW